LIKREKGLKILAKRKKRKMVRKELASNGKTA
jgi:hypothetical protein